MNTTNTVRHYFWTGTDFATCIVLQSGTVTAFTSLYVAPLRQDFGLKERVWQQEAVLSSKELATRLTKRMALRTFHAATEPFKVWAANTAQQQEGRLHIQTHSLLLWRAPTPGQQVTALRPVEAYFSGSEGFPRC